MRWPVQQGIGDGLGFPYMRRHLSGRPETAVALSDAQVSLGGLLLLLVAPLGELPDELPGIAAWLSILALGALGTGVAYILNFNVVRSAGAQTASMVTCLVPSSRSSSGSRSSTSRSAGTSRPAAR